MLCLIVHFSDWTRGIADHPVDMVLRDRLAKSMVYVVVIMHLATSLDFHGSTARTDSFVHLTESIHTRLRSIFASPAPDATLCAENEAQDLNCEPHLRGVDRNVSLALPDPDLPLHPSADNAAIAKQAMKGHPFALLTGWYQSGWAKALLALIPDTLEESERLIVLRLAQMQALS